MAKWRKKRRRYIYKRLFIPMLLLWPLCCSSSSSRPFYSVWIRYCSIALDQPSVDQSSVIRRKPFEVMSKTLLLSSLHPWLSQHIIWRFFFPLLPLNILPKKLVSCVYAACLTTLAYSPSPPTQHTHTHTKCMYHLMPSNDDDVYGE